MNDILCQRIAKLDAAVAFRIISPTYEENESTGKMRQVSTGHFICDVYDNTLKEKYAEAKGTSEIDALTKALDVAEKSPKPMTPAQKADAEARREFAAAKEAEIEALKARLAEYENKAPKKKDAKE